MTLNDDDIDDDMFADLLSGSEEENEKDEHKPKLKLTTNNSKTQSSNSHDGNELIILYFLRVKHKH